MIVSKQNIANEILTYLTNSHKAMLKVLNELVAFETPSNNKEAQNAIFNYLKEKLNNLDYYSIRVMGEKTGGYLYARPKKRNRNKPLQLLLGHCDTVWQLNTLQEMPFHHSKEKTKGPGVYDMKAGITQILFALKTIKDLSLDLSVVPIILINSDEEIGSLESTPVIKRLSKIVNRAYVLEPPLGLEGKLKTARKGIGRFTLTVKGKASHAGLDPKKGVSAIVELSHQVQQLYGMNDFEKGITVNVGLIEGGSSANVIASESKAIIDVRVLNHEDGVYITNKIHKLEPLFDNVILKIEGKIGREPMEKTARNQHLWLKAKANAELIGVDLQQAISGGGSDGNTTSLYTATLDGLGTTGDGAHAKHEFIYTNKLIERSVLLTLLLLENELEKTIN